MARGSIFKASLSPEQLEVEQRLRTLALMLVGLAVIACGLYYLEGILIPLVLALALTYTLQPMIDLLSKRPLHLCGRKFFAQQPAAIREARPMLRPFYELVYLAKLPWWLATCIAVSVVVPAGRTCGEIHRDEPRLSEIRSPCSCWWASASWWPTRCRSLPRRRTRARVESRGGGDREEPRLRRD